MTQTAQAQRDSFQFGIQISHNLLEIAGKICEIFKEMKFVNLFSNTRNGRF